jgi:hypothetical protein
MDVLFEGTEDVVRGALCMGGTCDENRQIRFAVVPAVGLVDVVAVVQPHEAPR